MIKGHVAAWLSMLLIEVLVIAIWGSADSIRHSLMHEIAQTRLLMGDRAVDSAVTTANEVFRSQLKGAVLYSEKKLIHKEVPEKGFESLLLPFVHGLSATTNSIVTTFWSNLYRMVFRANLWLVWVVPIALLLVPAVVSGLTSRRLKTYRFGYTNPVTFNLATHAGILALFLPVALLLSPIYIHPLVYPAWGVVLAALAFVGLANYQTTA